MGNDKLQTLQDEALNKIGIVQGVNSNNSNTGFSSTEPIASQPGAFSCTVPLNANGGEASAERLHVKKEVQLSSTMEAELLQKQGVATAGTSNNSIVKSLQEALLRKQAPVNPQVPATKVADEEQVLDGDLDLEAGRVQNDLIAFEASVDGKASELVHQNDHQQQQQPSVQDLLDEDILDTISVSEEEPEEDNEDKPPASQEEDISDTHDETLGDSTNVEAELAPDFEGLEREHNILVQRIREMSTREIVEAEVIPGKRRARMIGTFVVVLTLIIVVTLSVLLTKNEDDAEVVVVEGSCTENSPPIDVDTNTERYQAMLSIFDPVYGADIFADQSAENPRFRALHWVANEDPLMMSLESIKLQYIQQRYIMALLYFSTQGWCWTNKLNWLSSFDVCRWEHVLCSSGLVQKIGIPTNNLVGTLSSELGQLSNSLDRLDLAYNNLTGSIPTEFGRLTKMADLSFGNNRLTGVIPTELGMLKDMWFFSLTTNNITGPLPDEFGNLSALKELFISGNELTGTVPKKVVNLPLLQRFYFHDNRFVGNLDDEGLCAAEPAYTFRTDSNLTEVGADCTDEVVCSCCSFCCKLEECCNLLENGDRECLPRDG